MFLTLAPPIPELGVGAAVGAARTSSGGYRRLGRSCIWRPTRACSASSRKAAARRYRGRVELYSIWNEPNLEHYLYPQLQRTRHGQFVDLAAVRYRELW